MKKRTIDLQKKLVLGKESISSLHAGAIHGGTAHVTQVGFTCEALCLSINASCPANNTCGGNATCLLPTANAATCVGTMSGCGGC